MALAEAAADSAAEAAAIPVRTCCPGSYNVALVVDGKTVETKPLRVAGDPEVALTEAQRKQLYDMAMEMHELQKRDHRSGRWPGGAQPPDHAALDRGRRARPTSPPT